MGQHIACDFPCKNNQLRQSVRVRSSPVSDTAENIQNTFPDCRSEKTFWKRSKLEREREATSEKKYKLD